MSAEVDPDWDEMNWQLYHEVLVPLREEMLQEHHRFLESGIDLDDLPVRVVSAKQYDALKQLAMWSSGDFVTRVSRYLGRKIVEAGA